MDGELTVENRTSGGYAEHAGAPAHTERVEKWEADCGERGHMRDRAIERGPEFLTRAVRTEM